MKYPQNKVPGNIKEVNKAFNSQNLPQKKIIPKFNKLALFSGL